MKEEKLYYRCIVCGRKLKTRESQILGMGKVCARKRKNVFKLKHLFTM